MENNQTLLVLMHLDPSGSHPLYRRRAEKPELPLLKEGERHYLLANVLDSNERSTSAPVAIIDLSGEALTTYNDIVIRFDQLMKRFYGTGGYVARPETFTESEQAHLEDSISEIGKLTYELFVEKDQTANSPVRTWLDKTLRVKGRPEKHVTVVTNDFNIPWFWAKNMRHGISFCEACFLGTLQLTARGQQRETAGRGTDDGRNHGAMLINGSPELPFAQEEMGVISEALRGRWSSRKPALATCTSVEDVFNVVNHHPEETDYRLVHFSGHYGENRLDIHNKNLHIGILKDVLAGSLLVLDGCSSAHGLTGWAEPAVQDSSHHHGLPWAGDHGVEGITSRLINEGGVLGCVATVLPVKHDPIASKEFWPTFYTALLRNHTPGEALWFARDKLHTHYKKHRRCHNPMWSAYQLIGNAAATLFSGDGDARAND